MHGSRRSRGARRTIARGGALALALLLCLLVAAPASDAGLVGKDGKVYACYRVKGKGKGSVRLVRKKAHCRKGEKKTSWNVTGPSGNAGENGAGGENGTAGEPGGGGAAGLERQVATLQNKVESLESELKGITNLALTEVISKLQGISGAQLQQTIASLADVNALCVQAKKLTEQSNSLGGAFQMISLTGVTGILSGLGLSVPVIPPLSAFGCP